MGGVGGWGGEWGDGSELRRGKYIDFGENFKSQR